MEPYKVKSTNNNDYIAVKQHDVLSSTTLGPCKLSKMWSKIISKDYIDSDHQCKNATT